MSEPSRKKSGRGFLSELWQRRALLVNLSKNDFRTRYAGSYLGIIWAFVQPVVTVFIYWLIFGLGLRGTHSDAVPFLVYLTSGIVPWFYCQEALMSGTNVLLDYSYLVKKVVFDIRLLPLIKVISASFVHLFFIAIAVIIAWIYGYPPTLYLLQIVYYFFCLILFVCGIVYATSAVVVFFRDLTQIVGIALQIGIWTVPIMFQPETMSFGTKYGFIFKINPMYYIVNGYRDAIYARSVIWDHPWMTLYFWCFTILLLLIGGSIFRKMKVHFADVL